MKPQLKQALLRAVGAATRRHAVLLGGGASSDDGIAAVAAPYRVDGDLVVLRIGEPGAGTLTATYVERGADVWSSGALAYIGPAELELALPTGTVIYRGPATAGPHIAEAGHHVGGRPIGSVSGGAPVTARRFEWRIELTPEAGRVRTRRTSHYVVRHGRAGDASYYEGEDYVDYERESQEVHETMVALALEHEATGPVLELGCATGGTLAALAAAGLNGIGLDISDWAVARAAERLGPGRAFVCDVERDQMPPAVVAAAPFGLLVMASVFEHFASPFDVARSMAALVRPGGLLLIVTSNADSLSHRVFGRDWEGHFDWTHHGIEQVTPAAMRERLPVAGWRIRAMHTWHLWDGSNDPIHATIRDWFVADARFRRLLRERELGDFLTCVAERTGD